MRVASLLVGALLAGGLVGSASAQTKKPDHAAMRGSVQDTLGHPLSDATIEILGTSLKLNTPQSGSYLFDSIPPGRYWVSVRRIGYSPLRAALTFNRHQDREIDFQLEEQPVRLPEVVVNAEHELWNRKYQDFAWRSKAARGRFLTRDDLERWPYSRLSEVVARYNPFGFSGAPRAGVVAAGWGRTSLGWDVSSSGFGSCVPGVSINGGRPLAGWRLDDFYAEDVEAVEIYRTASMLPVEFQGFGQECGVVVVWMTR